MLIDLMKLHNTLMTIETKGENTKIMSDCLKYLENMIGAEQHKTKVQEKGEDDND